MSGFPEDLLSRAFRSGHGTQYNRVSYEMRESRPSVRFYEVVLEPDARWDKLRDEVFPAMARYMRSKGLDPVTGTGLVVTLFHGERFHLLEGAEIVKAYIETERLNRAAYARRVERWLG